MSKGLRRRALFALPVALPVAAVAAKVAPAHVRSLWGGVLSPSAIRRVENLKPLPFTFEELWEPPGGKSPFRFIKTVDMRWPKSDAIDKALDGLLRSARAPAKFSDDDLAATLGLDMKKSCGGVEGHATDAARIADASRAPSTSPVNGSAAGVEPCPQDFPAQPVVA